MSTAMDQQLVAQFEDLMARVQTTKNLVMQKDAEITRLTAQARDRMAVLPTGESEAVKKLRTEVGKRKLDLESLRAELHSKTMENDQQKLRVQQETQLVGNLAKGEGEEEKQIQMLRSENDQLQAEVRKLTSKLSLLTDRQAHVEERMLEKERQVSTAQGRNEQNARTEREFANQLRDLEQLKTEHKHKEELLHELNEIIEEMDESFEVLDSVAETLHVERLSARGSGRAGATAFERSPALRLWLGSTAAALATMKVVKLGKKRGQNWVTTEQREQAQADIVKRLAEVETVKQRLQGRGDEMHAEVEATRAKLSEKQRERGKAVQDRDKLQAILDDPDGVLSGLKQQIPELEDQKFAAEGAEMAARQEYERVQAATAQKYAAAKRALEQQMQLLIDEEEGAREIYEKTRELKMKETALFRQRIRQEAEAEEMQEEAELHRRGMWGGGSVAELVDER